MSEDGHMQEIEVFDAADVTWRAGQVPETGWLWVEDRGLFVIEDGAVRPPTPEEEARIRNMDVEEVLSGDDPPLYMGGGGEIR